MKLWDKGYTINNLVEKFTIGKDRELDVKLAKYDVLGSIAHAQMLASTGIISTTDHQAIDTGLHQILAEISSGQFKIEEGFEDVHSKVEYQLTEMIGEPAKKLHTARSRNDQVLVDLHLYAKEELQIVDSQVRKLATLLLNLSEQYKDILMPGYTHTQVAMPSSFGLWFAAHAETLIDDLHMVKAAYHIADQNPLGSAAGYGSSFAINRTLTTETLGFTTMKYNSVAAQHSRGKMEQSVTYALASIASTMGKLASDICLFMNQNFGFISFPDQLTTGSSIMPHKKNPDVFELVRAKANKIQGSPAALAIVLSNLTTGYHRDFQELKEMFIENIETTKSILEVSNFMLQHIEVYPDILDDEIYDHLYTVESVNELVIQGTPFREAYQTVGASVQSGTYVPKSVINHSHEGSIGNLCNAEIKTKMNNIKLEA